MGGGSIPTDGAARARVVTAVAAVATAAALGFLLVAPEGSNRRILVPLAAIGILAVLVALAGRAAAATWAVMVLGAEYSIFLLGRGAIDVRAPLVGAGLLAMSELIHWSLRARSSPRERWMSRRQLADLPLLWLGSLAVGSLTLVLGSMGTREGIQVAVVGTVASSATLGLVFLLARRRSTG